MNGKKIIKASIYVIVLLLLIIFLYNVIAMAVGANDYTTDFAYAAGIEAIVKTTDPKTIIGKTFKFTANGDLYKSKYMYCLECNQKTQDNAPYIIEKCVEIDGTTATCLYKSNGEWVKKTNTNEYNGVLALILNTTKSPLGCGPKMNWNAAQYSVWNYFKYWSNNSGNQIDVKKYWAAANGYTYADGDLSWLDDIVLETALKDYSNGKRAKVRFYLLSHHQDDNTNNWTNTWQSVMIAIPGEFSTPKDLVLEKVDQDTNKKMGGVQFVIKNNKNELLQATGPNSNNVYMYKGTTTDANQATKFTTGTTSAYKSITIKNVPDGNYTVKELYTPYEGYENNHMKEWTVSKNDKSNSAEKLIVTLKNDKGYDSKKPTPTKVKGKVTISGFVWEDIATGKNGAINSIYDTNEQKIQGIKVYWKDKDGNLIKSTTTDKDGKYSFSMELLFQNHPYKLLDQAKYDKINTSYIEFDYNGIKYTTVANTSNLTKANVSQGIEIVADRNAVDNKFDIIENNKIKDNGTAIGTVDNVSNYINENYLEKYAVTATTSKITNILKTTESQGWTKKATFCTAHCSKGYRLHEIARINLSKNGATATIVIHCHGGATVENWNDPKGLLERDIANYLTTYAEIKGEEFNNTDILNKGLHYYSAGETSSTIRDCTTGAEKVIEWNIKNVNLGLVKREQPDIAITSDIEKVRVIMKNQEYTYIYGNRGIQNGDIFDYQVKFENKYLEQVYSRPVNPANVSYVNMNNSNELKVYVTYNILGKNQSSTLYMTAQNIVNYYDSGYTIYTGQGSATSAGWQEVTNINNGYKMVYNSSWSGKKLAPGEKTEMLKIEFEISKEKIEGLLKDEEVLFKNVSEIVGYTTYYGGTTRCAENINAQTKGKVAQQYAGIDQDSIPGNAIPGVRKTYEDDTDQAPVFKLVRKEYQTISGTVWEDTQTSESAGKNERLGNGIKEDTEKGIKGVKVQLLEANDDGTPKLDAEGNTIVAQLYKTENGNAVSTKAEVTTGSDGNYTLGNKNSEGIATGKYIIRYIYGDGTTIDGTTFINGRNYKSTIITQSPIKEIMKGTSQNDKWYLTMPDNASIAVDDMNDRLATPDTLQYSNFNDAITISAYSEPFQLKVEYSEANSSQVDANGGTFATDWNRFDFGIIERPREDIVVDKTVSNVRLILGNGQELISGDPRLTDTPITYVKSIGFRKDPITTKVEAKSALDKLLSIEIDAELIQGATLDATYEITVTNNSEIDYEYDLNKVDYYYYGENPTTIIDQSVELLADYIDAELVCDLEENKDWKKATADELKDNGYISEKTYNALRTGKYTMLVSELNTETETLAPVRPGQAKQQIKRALSVRKGLSNSEKTEDTNVFDNHTEILTTNGKVGRTIDSSDKGTQIVKTYKPGNYIPSLANRIYNADGSLELEGLHQPDDDRVRIVVTPPTGITNNKSYIITALIGLIVVLAGIILIKKKILDK